MNRANVGFIVVVILVVGVAQMTSAQCACAVENSETAYTFKTDEHGDLAKDDKGSPVVVESRKLFVKTPVSAPKSKSVKASRIEDVRECETDSSSPDGRRTSCKSGTFKFTCPAGHYLVRKPTSREHYEIISERGSENHYWIEWADEVEIYPDTDIYVPTSVTWQVGARSNKGPNGSPGKTKARFICDVKKLPKS